MSARIKLAVPGSLVFRDVAIRAVASACQLVRDSSVTNDMGLSLDLAHEFDAHMVSAVSEIFNNIVIHGYRRPVLDLDAADLPAEPSVSAETIEFELILSNYQLEVIITDCGETFDITDVPSPELDKLPEGGMGIHIARSFVDELVYTGGQPNIWRLIKSITQPKSVTQRDR